MKLRIIIFVFSLLGLTMFVSVPKVLAQSATSQQLQCGANAAANGDCDSGTPPANPEKSINSLISKILNIFSVVVGIAAVFMIILGGFRYITSSGDSGKTKTAKDTILFALVGLVVVALAQVIVKFVLAKTAT